MDFGSCRSLLQISYSEEITDGQPVCICSNALPVKASKLEPAGHAFHDAALRLTGQFVEAFKSEDNGKGISVEKEQAYVHSSDSFSSKGKKKSGGESQQQDHYALLGLSHLRYLATEDQIRKCYREAALRHHPDKQAALLLAEETEEAKQVKKDKIESHFKAIQEAYEVLIDPVRRRIYDSTDEFDDEIPCDCSPQEFFKVFGPAFLRNGRWSVNQPVPTLGDDGTLIDEVDGFYNFWYNFKSWREFPHADEFDLEQAESRDHKRWMERQNAKLSEKARKEEYVRIRALVDNAYKRDPRILRRKEEQKADKQRKKEEKFLARKLLEEEAARIAIEERRRKEEEEKIAAEAALNQKKLKEKEKKLLRKEKTRFRTLANPILSQNLLGLTDDDVETICSLLDKEQLRDLCDRMEGKEALLDRGKLLREIIVDDKNPNAEDVNSKRNGPKSVTADSAYSSYQKSEAPWGKDEIELLRKGMQKYPKGTSRRWEVISEYVGTNRSVEEILKATKTVLLQKPDPAKSFDAFLEKRKPAPTIASPLSTRVETSPVTDNTTPENHPKSSGDSEKEKTPLDSGNEDVWSEAQERALIQVLKTFPKQASKSWDRIAAAVPEKSEEQCRKKFALMKESFRNNSNSSSKPASNGEESSYEPEKSNGSVHVEVENGGVSSGSDGDAWSEVQEKALITALKAFPKDTNQRWERVAAAVPGKTVNQCKKKFASLKESFRNLKSAA